MGFVSTVALVVALLSLGPATTVAAVARAAKPLRHVTVQILILRDSANTPSGIDAKCDTCITPDRKPHLVWSGSGSYSTSRLPQEVVWKVVGLGRTDKLEIVSRAGQTGFFPWPKREMDFGKPEAHSGPAACRPFGGKPRENWAYSIILNPGPEQLTLDPVIIIEQ